MRVVLAQAPVAAALMALSYVLAYYLNGLVEGGVLAVLFGSYQMIFLPHGMKLILTWMYGWLAVVIMLPVSAGAALVLLGATHSPPTMTALVLLKVMSMPVAFEAFRLSGLDLRGRDHALNWKVLFLVAFLSAVLNAVGRQALGCCTGLAATEVVPSIVGAMLGDMLGAVAVMLTAMMVFRLVRQARLVRLTRAG